MRIGEGWPQRYGTQLEWSAEGELVPWILEDAARVDEYRQQVGLESLAQRLEQARGGMKGVIPPSDYRRFKAESEEWAKKAGW